MKARRDLLEFVAIAVGIFLAVVIVGLCSIIPAYILMVIAAQFGVVKPLWVWWLVAFFIGTFLRSSSKGANK